MVGELLQELRRDKGMTQAELAAKLGLSPLTVSSYECGRSTPDDETKIKLAKIFDISLDYMLGLVREPCSYRRGTAVIELPRDFAVKDIEKVKEYIAFLQYQKENNR